MLRGGEENKEDTVIKKNNEESLFGTISLFVCKL
jgi:hypothetical protein